MIYGVDILLLLTACALTDFLCYCTDLFLFYVNVKMKVMW